MSCMLIYVHILYLFIQIKILIKQNMKFKLTQSLLTLLIAFTMVACGGGKEGDTQTEETVTEEPNVEAVFVGSFSDAEVLRTDDKMGVVFVKFANSDKESPISYGRLSTQLPE